MLRLVDRSIYVEVHPDVDINNWSAELIYNAIVTFTFGKKLREKDILGVRINPDVTYEFFDIEDSLSQGRGTLRGKIYRYFPDKKYGFIETEGMGQWYFNIDGIKDTKLIESFLPKAKLDTENNRLLRPIFVDFEDAGYKGSESGSPRALDIKLSKGKG